MGLELGGPLPAPEGEGLGGGECNLFQPLTRKIFVRLLKIFVLKMEACC